jgi:hypothetical protein
MRDEAIDKLEIDLIIYYKKVSPINICTLDVFRCFTP